jgi:hypothetical protein
MLLVICICFPGERHALCAGQGDLSRALRQLRQFREGIFHGLSDVLIEKVEVRSTRNPEPEVTDWLLQGSRVIGDRMLFARDVQAVVAGERLKHDGPVLDGPGHRTTVSLVTMFGFHAADDDWFEPALTAHHGHHGRHAKTASMTYRVP